MRRAVRLWPLLFVWLFLGATCSESSINQDIHDTFGINTDSPVQVAGVILLGKKFGNAEEQQAADMGSTIKDFRRADHEQKGDRARDARDYDGAEREYREALQWTGTGPQQDIKRADLETRLGETLAWKAVFGERVSQEREAAQHYGTAAALREKDPAYQKNPGAIGELYLNQAFASLNARDWGASCSALRKAAAKGRDNPDLRADLKNNGLTCDR